MPWYSMTAIYRWEPTGDKLPKYERRITICSAVDEAAATEVLLREAKEYPGSEPIVFLGEYDVEAIDEPPGRVPVEVAHELTIGVDLTTGAFMEPAQFLERHWRASRIESCDIFGFQHAWHNIDDVTSGCYNCKVVREGQLWR